MKKSLFITIAVLLCASCQESLEDRCAREAKDYTEKKCPAAINEFTRIDSLTFDKATHTMHYYYTLSGNADNAEAVAQTNPRELLVNEVRNMTAMEIYREAGYSFAYSYRSASNPTMILFETTIEKKDYQ